MKKLIFTIMVLMITLIVSCGNNPVNSNNPQSDSITVELNSDTNDIIEETIETETETENSNDIMTPSLINYISQSIEDDTNTTEEKSDVLLTDVEKEADSVLHAKIIVFLKEMQIDTVNTFGVDVSCSFSADSVVINVQSDDYVARNISLIDTASINSSETYCITIEGWYTGGSYESSIYSPAIMTKSLMEFSMSFYIAIDINGDLDKDNSAIKYKFFDNWYANYESENSSEKVYYSDMFAGFLLSYDEFTGLKLDMFNSIYNFFK